MSIYIFVLNLDSNKDRWIFMKNQLDKLDCKYERINACNGYQMEKNEDQDHYEKLLYNRNNAIGREFICYESKDNWIYDGSLEKSWPGLHLKGHYGTKGLTLSNLDAFNKGQELNYDYYLILEDDAEISIREYEKIKELIAEQKFMDIFLLDERSNGLCGTAGMLYKRNVLKQLATDLEPTSEYSINFEKENKYTNLFDWKILTYIKWKKMKYLNYGLLKSGKFKSTIS